jgi:ABC-type branched-subunit amino acid transport system substrate-binding protein
MGAVPAPLATPAAQHWVVVARRLRIGACLSLTGRYARFGLQAARGLRTWQALGGGADLLVEDDAGDPARLAALIGGLASRCDLLLGPYSTGLTRAAIGALEDRDCLLWNHGGAGDSVQVARPGRVVSVLTPASRYAEPYVDWLAGRPDRAQLWLLHGRGAFAREVTGGAEALAGQLGLRVARIGPAEALPDDPDATDLLCAGSFEEDVAAVARAAALPRPPRTICAVAAGVREFGAAVPDPAGVLGLAQWLPGAAPATGLGPGEAAFLRAYGTTPDYPAVQAAAAAILATRCAGVAGAVRPDQLWSAAAALHATTLFGPFAIDAATGRQVGHRTVLGHWTPAGLQRAGPAGA